MTAIRDALTTFWIVVAWMLRGLAYWCDRRAVGGRALAAYVRAREDPTEENLLLAQRLLMEASARVGHDGGAAIMILMRHTTIVHLLRKLKSPNEDGGDENEHVDDGAEGYEL